MAMILAHQVRRLARHLLPAKWQLALERWRHLPNQGDKVLFNQRTLAELYLSQSNSPLRPLRACHSSINRFELTFHSQNGEDGILMFIFSLIGVSQRSLVEIGVGSGRECNAAHLLLACGWRGLLIDGSFLNVRLGTAYYRQELGIAADRVRIQQCLVTRENVNELLQASRTSEGELDLLSIDVDGIDYWIWQAVTEVRPRVVVIEYNASLGPNASLVVPYDPTFDRMKKSPSGYFHGASLRALEKLGLEKGYRLVGCESRGLNAFFVRNDCMVESLEAIGSSKAFYEHLRRSKGLPLDEQMAITSKLPFAEV